MSAGALIAKAVGAALSDGRGRKAMGWILAALFSPLALVVVAFCSLGSAGSEHNAATVDACFYGGSFTERMPAEYRDTITRMRGAFAVLDEAVASANAQMVHESLDPTWIKAHFYALCFGSDSWNQETLYRFAACFYTTHKQMPEGKGDIPPEETGHTVAHPCASEAVNERLAAELGRKITEADRKNISLVYARIAGTVNSGVQGGGIYVRGTGYGVEIDLSGYVDPTRKNAADLAAYAIHAWEQGWGYVWGTCGWVLTPELLASKCEQYPEGVGQDEPFIRTNWLGGRTADCVGLIKGYGWLDAKTLTVGYAVNGMPDVGANEMFCAATVTGTIDTIPERPGVAVWRDGHIGVYVGGGYVIEAVSTQFGVVKTKLAERSFTHWLEIPYIEYD